MQRVLWVLAVCTMVLTGCETLSGSTYGNFLDSTVDQEKLAIEAAQRMTALWPPAQIQLVLKQPTPDIFGTALVKSLRESGYAVAEFNQASQQQETQFKRNALPLRYVLDGMDSPNSYRLTLLVGDQSISRMYLLRQNGTVASGGFWVRKE